MKKISDSIDDINETVCIALREDIGDGDLTASLIPSENVSAATVISREIAVLCGIAWFDEVFRQLDSSIKITWNKIDGDLLEADEIICHLQGPTRSLLAGERTALNFLQTLSGTATVTREFVNLLNGYKTKLMDTRKTMPCLRSAQKYAVTCGGGINHRMGLFDAILIKENHVLAAGGIRNAVSQAKKMDVTIEVEVESMAELEEAIEAGADIILLDNFTPDQLREAVEKTRGHVKLEASGNISLDNLQKIAETGVDYVSIGALTKHIRSIDFSMRFAN